MTSAAPATRVDPGSWPQRLRFGLALAAVWAGLHYLVEVPLLPRGFDWPLVMLPGRLGVLAALVCLGVLWAGGALAALLLGPGERARAMLVLGFALAIWGAEAGRAGGTMDDWLIRCHAAPGAPSGGPYWRLLPDYLVLLAGLAGAYACTALVHGPAPGQPWITRWNRAWQPADAVSRTRGPLALLVAAAAGGVMAIILSAPAVSETYRGQVYFAFGLGSFAGVFAARQLTGVRDPLWYWPVPLLIGAVGLVVAGLRPALMLPPAYQLDTIPAWGLARGLPVELAGAGLVGALWNLHAGEQEPDRPAA